MKLQWFKKAGWIYIPTSFAGIVITAGILFFCVTVFIAIDRNSHSVSDTLYGIFPYFASAITILFWIASHTAAHTSDPQ